MRRRILMVRCAVALVLAAVIAPTTLAVGYWNMPGTLAQWKGHGYGGGYHAPLILGPVRFDAWHGPNQVRWPHAPVSSCWCNNSCECGRLMEAPSAMGGVVPTSVLPTPVAEQPADIAPVETAPIETVPVEEPPMPQVESAPVDGETSIEPVSEPSLDTAAAVTSEVTELRPLFDPPVQP